MIYSADPTDAIEEGRIERSMSVKVGDSEVCRKRLTGPGALLIGVKKQGHAHARKVEHLSGKRLLTWV
jgi:hypothetical protein